MKTGRTEFIRRAVDSGDAHLIEEEGKVIAVGVLEYTFFEHGFISLVFVNPEERRTGVGEMLLRYLISICRTPKVFSLDQSQQRPDASAVWKGWLRKERHNPQPRPSRSRTHLFWTNQGKNKLVQKMTPALPGEKFWFTTIACAHQTQHQKERAIGENEFSRSGNHGLAPFLWGYHSRPETIRTYHLDASVEEAKRRGITIVSQFPS